jgi:hypothetical protein
MRIGSISFSSFALYERSSWLDVPPRKIQYILEVLGATKKKTTSGSNDKHSDGKAGTILPTTNVRHITRVRPNCIWIAG